MLNELINTRVVLALLVISVQPYASKSRQECNRDVYVAKFAFIARLCCRVEQPTHPSKGPPLVYARAFLFALACV